MNVVFTPNNPVLPATFDDSLSYYELIAKLNYSFNSVVTQIQDMLDGFTNDSQEYTDTQIQNALIQFTQLVNDLEASFNVLQNSVNQSIENINTEFDDYQNTINAEVQGVKAYTDIKVKENNEEILNTLSEQLSNIKVINYFTGEKVPIQQMFDYLAGLHTTDSITYAELAERNITYTQYAALNITYSQLVNNGNSLVTTGG